MGNVQDGQFVDFQLSKEETWFAQKVEVGTMIDTM